MVRALSAIALDIASVWRDNLDERLSSCLTRGTSGRNLVRMHAFGVAIVESAHVLASFHQWRPTPNHETSPLSERGGVYPPRASAFALQTGSARLSKQDTHELARLMGRRVEQGQKQRGNVHVFVEFGPEQLLAVHRDSEVLTLRYRGCLQNRKPVQRELHRSTVGQVEKQVRAVEAHVQRSAFHGRLPNENHLIR